MPDLEVPGSQLVLLTGAAPFADRSIRVFDPTTLQVVSRFGRVDQPMVMTDEGDLWQYNVSPVNAPAAPNLALTAQGYYVTLYEDYVCVWSHGSDSAIGVKNLREISQGSPPVARVAIGLATGDVDGDGYDDVVITTADGRVMWFTINELTSPTLCIPFTRSVQLIGSSCTSTA